MSKILICTAVSLVSYFILLLITTNLIGMIVRGVLDIVNKTYDTNSHTIINEAQNKFRRSNIIVTILFTVLTISFLFFLYHFLNFGILLVAALLMIARIPDLLYEIKTGVKITSKTGPRGVVKYIILIIDWGSFLVLWLSMYKLF